MWWLVAILWCCCGAFADALRCPTDVLVAYRMVLQTEWTRERFPKHYPEWRPHAQWSLVLGRSHNESGIVWRLGRTAADPVKLFLETGRADPLIAGEKRGVLSEFFAPPIARGDGTTEAKFFVDALHPKVSVICRIIPSPDWFVGVDSLDLCHGGRWVDSAALDLQPLDAGIQSGYTFTSPKWATEPRHNFTLIRSGWPDHPAGSFYYPELEQLPRIATLRLLKTAEFQLQPKAPARSGFKRSSQGGRATVISPMNELQKFPIHGKRPRKVKKTKKKELEAFSSKTDTTTEHRTRSVYKQHKPCRVSEWSEWDACSSACGFGNQVRRRTVLRLSSGGGGVCPPLEQTAWCKGTETCGNETASGLFRWK